MGLSRLHIEGTRFVDAHGRSVILRGVNLGGDCKIPYPDGGTHLPTDFADHRQVSFVGRPFPLDQADAHLGRLRHWGFNCVRLLTTWEAIEHAGPGQLDEVYLDYLAEVCRRAGEHGLYVFVDMHQDVFSRMTGGDGAPGWVLETCGLDIPAIGPADAAIVMQHRYDPDDPRPRQPERYPLMCWSQNYLAPANGVLWTLFFAGRDFAPSFVVDGQNIQDYLQGHYLASQRAVAERLREQPHVIGFDSLNEPGMGFIGLGMTGRRGVDRPGELTLPGLAWSPLDALFAMDGHPVELPFYELKVLRGGCVETMRRTGNPTSRRVWRDGARDPFAAAGAWCLDHQGQPVALIPDYFSTVRGRQVHFERDYLLPFVHRVADSVRGVRADWLIFFEKDGNSTFADPSFPDGVPADAVYAPHWYDLVTLMLKRFVGLGSYDAVRGRPVLGSRGILDMYVHQLGLLQRTASWMKRSVPTLIGEFGIPFDLDEGAAYAAWASGDRSDRPWRPHVQALDLMYDAMDALLLSSTQWNYTASNRNDARIGDGWNQEDLSLFSVDQQADPADPDSGGRGLDGVVRPYARRVQGAPLSMRFDRERGEFSVELQADPAIAEPTEIFVPRRQYPQGFSVEVQDADVEAHPAEQRVLVRARKAGPLRVEIRRRDGKVRAGSRARPS
jgi:hypothetical protein